ncbi:hypothetical protein SPI_03012 [Niveomyces insectorum RCEF 264]|uniref:Uncharacterized protein n=1 Tax=Niveomyces insectorum RCEF 264 TaxID=1081102 RepID=A0A167WZX5_9HYPO|nr:hypothetical protein SPI_03012 [Niveomyces insectorum RCEF 264]
MAEKRPRQETYESEEDVSEDQQQNEPPRQQRQMQRRNKPQQRQQGGGGPLDGLPLDNVGNTAQGIAGGVTNTLGNVAGGAVQDQGGKKSSDTLRLRLDLNLDVEITLKAKIHGDLELALLYVKPPPSTCLFFHGRHQIILDEVCLCFGLHYYFLA